MHQPKQRSFEEYLKTQPGAVVQKLTGIRDIVQSAAPKALLTFSYGVPAFKTTKTILIFAGFKNHIGIYPGPETIKKFKDELMAFKQSKGSVKFPNDKPLLLDVIKEIVIYNLNNH